MVDVGIRLTRVSPLLTAYLTGSLPAEADVNRRTSHEGDVSLLSQKQLYQIIQAFECFAYRSAGKSC